jgi:RHS repeat-associated protein
MVLSGSTVAWIYGFQGGRFDPAANLIQFDVREFNITTGTWLQQDPDKYVDGPNTYEFVKDNPGNYTDPSGESSTKQDYQNAALKRAGIDPSTWDPGKGFDSQKDNVNKVYDYYKSIFKANHNLKWAGLARLAGGAVVDGLKKIKAIKDKFQKKLDDVKERGELTHLRAPRFDPPGRHAR